MNSIEYKEIMSEFKELHCKVDTIHDDVLVLKTQRNMVVKVAAVVGGAVSLVVSIAAFLFGR